MHVNRREFIIVGVAGVATCRSQGAPPVSSDGAPPAGTRVRVDFSGLCGVVVSGSPSRLDVLLVDGLQTLGQTHLPRLFTDSSNVTSESTPPDGTVTGGPSSLAFWELKDHRATLASGEMAGVTRVTDRRDPSHQIPATATEQDDVSWLAGMARIAAAGPGRINPECLGADPRPAKVAASARFTGGEMKARFDPPFHQVKWRVLSPGVTSPFEQALGEVRLSQTVNSDTVNFTLEPFAGGSTRQIVLRPTGGEMSVQIRNLPGHVGCSTDFDVRNLAHFGAFYQLLAPPNQANGGPVPTCAEPGCQLRCVGHEDRPIYCPPAEFAP